MHLQSFVLFRVLAISLVVLGHVRYISGWEANTFIEKYLYMTFVEGGTFYFAFISGFLFQYIFVSNFNFRKYLEGKLKTIFLPYLFLSIVPISVALITRNPYPDYFFYGDSGIYEDYIRPALLYFFSGRVLTGYWYIPFISLVFISSPLIVMFTSIRRCYQVAILLILFFISMLVHRPVDNMSPFQSYVYFIPVYLFGMFVSVNSNKIFEIFKDRLIYLLVISLGLSFFVAYFIGEFGNRHKIFLSYEGLDFMVVQRSLMCIFYYVLFTRLSQIESKWINLFAGASFSIYFLHVWVIYIINRIDINSIIGLPNFIYFIILFFFVMVLCVLSAYLVKKTLGARSRIFIGY